MYNVTKKEQLNPDICLVEFEAPDIAKAARAGQFIILRIDEKGERFPLTIYDYDVKKGTVCVVCQAVGVSTKKLCALNKNDFILDVAGPLGHAVSTEKIGNIICIGGGVGTAEAYPITKAYKESGNEVKVIIGARNKSLLICEKELKSLGVELYVATDDGSYGRKGFVTDVLKELLSKQKYDLIYAIGPIVMMKAVSQAAKPYNIKTLVSLNSIMIDGTGMCGGCRIKYNNESKFTCVDGPEFDASLIDFDELIKRQGRFSDKEKLALHEYECRLGFKH
ncbi:MAG: sulfide/dihydroorotate dehydrogenase-like FAD/NAD-binding protein [Candidatus Omnitrophica bacterium]|nr:sulfide/dihydroorotate dehydrogenase-like FAD/NAD-binding protein [Candidatus Omnitrophota bacterium]